MDGSDSSAAVDARSDVAEATADNADGGGPPGPTDAASEDGPGPSNSDAASDADATTTPDSAGVDADPADAAADIPQADIPQADVPTTSDATSDANDAAGDAADAAPSGFPGSALVDATQGAMINGWVGTPTQLWTLCYSTALHQRSGAAFHTNCAYKGPSVSIARVSYMTETRVIGGYNSGSWTTPAMQTYSPFSGSFLFSVTNAFKHDFPGSNSGPFWVFQNQYYGPTFGGGNDWYVHSQMTMGTCRPGFTYQCRVGTMDSTTCNIDFCGTPTQSDWYTLDVLEVWVK